jgi:hypothetical protein
MQQQWKTISEHPSYSVSNTGQVRNDKTNHQLKLNQHPKGYKQVTLWIEGKRQSLLVHRLVAMAFIPNPSNYNTVNHRNEIKHDNQISNLEWCSVQYNNEYSHAKTYQFINPVGTVVEVFNLAKFCSDNQLIHSCMSMLQSGKRKSHKGWTYATA